VATNTGPDLSGAQAAIELLMDDTCQVRRGDNDRADTYDQVTLAVIDTAPVLIYDGACMVRGEPTDRRTVDGGQTYADTIYNLTLPVGADVKVGDVCTVTSSRRDPHMGGETFDILEVIYKTFAISRKIRMKRRERV
jgi:hypothetical protein